MSNYKVSSTPTTTPSNDSPRATSLPGTARDEAQRSSAPLSFAMRAPFLEFLLGRGGEAFGHGGITRHELHILLGDWNRLHPDSPVRFDESAFRRMASRSGLQDKINREEVFISLGLPSSSRSFDFSKPFLEFLRTNAREAQKDGGLTIEEVTKAASAWNAMHQDNPRVWVVASREGFDRLALKDSSRSNTGHTTISVDELDVALGRNLPRRLDTDQRFHLQVGDLDQWKTRWPTSLPFTYESFRYSIDHHIGGVELRPGQRRGGSAVMPIGEAMSMVSQATGVSGFPSRITDAQRDQYQISQMDPFRRFDEALGERQRIIAQKDADFATALRERERQLGRRLTTAEADYFRLDRETQGVVEEAAGLIGKAWERATGLSLRNEPWARAATNFLGNFTATPAVAGRQMLLARQDLAQYLTSVFLALPDNGVALMKSVFPIEPGIPPEERFERALNTITLIVGASHGMRGSLGATKAEAMRVFTPGKFSVQERAILSQWVDHAGLVYASDTSPMGLLNRPHIERQASVLTSERANAWFRQNARLGFKQDEALAALYGTDLTKFNPAATAQALEFGRTNTAFEPLRYVPREVDPTAGPLHNLFAHAEGGAASTFRSLVELGRKNGLTQRQAEQLAFRTASHIVGHDSFRYGFGNNVLRPLLSEQSGLPLEAITYPMSRTPSGFVLQLVDRLEATLPETQLRYVMEGIGRKWDVTKSIESGVVTGYSTLKTTFEGLVSDARKSLTPQQFKAFMESPFVRDFTSALDNFKETLEILRKRGDGLYEIRSGDSWIKIDDFDTFKTVYVDAVKRHQASRP